MRELNLNEVTKYVEDNIGVFHQKRIERLNSLKLKTVLKKKNPYLFKAKHIFCLLYTSDAADERSSVDLGGRRIIKKKKRSQEYIRRAL